MLFSRYGQAILTVHERKSRLLIVAEWLAASNGLGYLVLSGSFNFNTARSFAAIIALAIIGTSFFSLMSWLERRISWRTDIGDSTTQA